MKRHELSPRWKLQTLANRYPRLSTDRDTAENNNLEWVTRGHPLFEALRRSSLESGRGSFAKGACFHSLGHESPARLDFYKAQVTDGLGQVIHERLFAVEISDGSEPKLRGPEVLGNLTTAERPSELPTVVSQPEPNQWLYQQALNPLLDEVKEERIPEIDRITEHELAQGKQVYDVHGMNLGYDMTSLDLVSGEPRFIEVKGLPAETGTILLTPNERRVAEDRRDCYWLHIVTNCAGVPVMQEPIQDPAKFLGMR